MSDKQTCLFPRLSLMSQSGLADNLYAAAQGVEELLLSSGAVPGEDYNRLELLKLVQPFVLEAVRNDESLDLLWGFNADEVID